MSWMWCSMFQAIENFEKNVVDLANYLERGTRSKSTLSQSKKETAFPRGRQFLFVFTRSKIPLHTEPHKASPKASCCRTASLRSHRRNSHNPTARERHPLSHRSNCTSPTAILPAASNTLPPTRRTSCTTCRTGNFPVPQR